VVATPGRLEDLLQRRELSLEHVHVLVLDEADRMLDMGFKPAVDRIVARVPADRQTLFFSATLEGAAGRQAAAYTRDARRHLHRPAPERRADVVHRFIHVGPDANLKAHRVATAVMHGNKSQTEREKALAHFESGTVSTLVATDVAARGIDVTGVTHVINFDAPPDRDSYLHRVGRTGRAGRTGAGVSFVLPDQARDMRRIAVDLGLTREFDRARRQR
jgi:ATP-dependent RNA helicase RhlE